MMNQVVVRSCHTFRNSRGSFVNNALHLQSSSKKVTSRSVTTNPVSRIQQSSLIKPLIESKWNLKSKSLSTLNSPSPKSSSEPSNAVIHDIHDDSSKSGKNTHTTVLKDEIDKFEKLASNWWSHSGEFKALHSMNELRVPFIRDGFLNNGQITTSNIEFPLKELNILDIGCGGGILSLPLARLGAQVVGLDAGQENIAMANSELHSANENCPNLKSKITFVCTTLEEFTNDQMSNEGFDGVVISEVLEHVANPKYFLQLAAQLIKPKGSIFITTINRTYLSWLGAVVAGEYIFKLLPAGTHNWKQFIPPEEIQSHMFQNGLSTRLIHGMKYNIWTNKWSWSQCTDINYALHAVK